MKLITFQNEAELKSFSAQVIAQRIDNQHWSIKTQTPNTVQGWPRVAIKEIDNKMHIVILHFLDKQDVIDIANILHGKPLEHLLNEDERLVVHMLALGDNIYRAQGETILMKYSREHFQLGRKSIEMQFLSEVFSKCPDLMLRNKYRKEILDTLPPGVSFDAEDSHFLHSDGSWMPKMFEEHWRARGSEFPQVKFM